MMCCNVVVLVGEEIRSILQVRDLLVSELTNFKTHRFFGNVFYPFLIIYWCDIVYWYDFSNWLFPLSFVELDERVLDQGLEGLLFLRRLRVSEPVRCM